MSLGLRREREHCIWYDGFGTNAPNPVMDLNTASLVLKHLALFYRGLVVSDADLNNNPVFYAVTQNPEADSSKAFREAIGAGFIRRAVRVVRDSKGDSRGATQAEVFQEFSERNPTAASRVPQDHPRVLDDMFADPERRGDPLYWSRADLDMIFASRLVFEVEAYISGGAGEIRALAQCVDEYARECLASRINVSAATLLRALTRRAEDLGSSRVESLDKVWKAVQRAYHGNLPLAFDGDLIVGASPGLGPPITGGPRAAPDDLRMTMQAFAEQNATGRTVMTVVSEEGVGWPPAPRMVNLGWLRDLSFSKIEELRESAYPEEMMDLRFKVLGAPDAADELRELHADATARFLSHHREYVQDLHEMPYMGKRIWLKPADDGPRIVAAITSPDPSMPCAIADPSLLRPSEGRRGSASSSLDQSFALTILRHHWRGLPGEIMRDAAGRLNIRLPGRAIAGTRDAVPDGGASDPPGGSLKTSVDIRVRPQPGPPVPASAPGAGTSLRVGSTDDLAQCVEKLAGSSTGGISWTRFCTLELAAQLVLLAFAYLSNDKSWNYASEHFSFEDGNAENHPGRVIRRYSALRNRAPPLEWERFLGVVPESDREETRRKIMESGRGGRPRQFDRR